MLLALISELLIFCFISLKNCRQFRFLLPLKQFFAVCSLNSYLDIKKQYECKVLTFWRQDSLRPRRARSETARCHRRTNQISTMICLKLTTDSNWLKLCSGTPRGAKPSLSPLYRGWATLNWQDLNPVSYINSPGTHPLQGISQGNTLNKH